MAILYHLLATAISNIIVLVSHFFLKGAISNTQLSATNHNWYKLMEASLNTECFLHRSVAEAVMTYKEICLLSKQIKEENMLFNCWRIQGCETNVLLLFHVL